MKNRRFIGSLQTQSVRTKSKPFIQEMGQYVLFIELAYIHIRFALSGMVYSERKLRIS